MFIFSDNKMIKSNDIVIRDTKYQQIIFTTLDNQNLNKWLKEEVQVPYQVFEDIVQESQSVSYEEYDGIKLLILKYLMFDKEEYLFYEEFNISLIHINNIVLILCENRDVLVELSQKFEKRYKKSNSLEYALYILVDILTDRLLSLANNLDDTFEDIENDILDEKVIEKELQRDVYFARRTLRKIIKISIQEAEVINKFYLFISKNAKKELKYDFIDLREHIQFLTNESRELLDRTGYLLNLHMGMMSNKMNQAMQKLASISLIFLPLTFIVGNYGMNFTHMPELSLKYGYAYVTILNVIVAGSIYIWLRRKKWL